MAIHNQFERFHQKVLIDAGRRDRIISAHRTLTDRLHRSSTAGSAIETTFLQGSYANSTAIRPLSGEYDVDVVVVLKQTAMKSHAWGHAAQLKGPGEAQSLIVRALQEYGDYSGRIRRLTRCIRLDYSGDFHLDVVPTVSSGTSSASLMIGDRYGRDWTWTNPKELIEWYRQQNARTNGNFNRVLRGLKRWRDVQSGVDIPSIAMAVFLGQGLRRPRGGNTHEHWMASGLEALYLQTASHWSAPVLRNPSLPSENLARDWGQSAFVRFKNAAASGYRSAAAALNARTEQEAATAWRALLGQDFPLS